MESLPERCASSLVVEGQKFKCVEFSPSGKYIATASTSVVFVWDMLPQSIAQTLTAPPSTEKPHWTKLCWSPGGLYVCVGGKKGNIVVWNVITAKTVFSTRHSSSISKLQFLPNSEYVVSFLFSSHSFSTASFFVVFLFRVFEECLLRNR